MVEREEMDCATMFWHMVVGAHGRRCAWSHIMWKFNGGHHFRQTLNMGCTERLGSRAKKRATFRDHCLDVER